MPSSSCHPARSSCSIKSLAGPSNNQANVEEVRPVMLLARLQSALGCVPAEPYPPLEQRGYFPFPLPWGLKRRKTENRVPRTLIGGDGNRRRFGVLTALKRRDGKSVPRGR